MINRHHNSPKLSRQKSGSSLFILLLMTAVASCLTFLVVSEVTAQQSSDIGNAQPAENQPRQRSSIVRAWQALLERLKEKEGPLGSRGEEKMCEVSPGRLGQSDEIWSERPLFLWYGTNPSLEIHLYSISPDYERQEVWSETVTAASESFLYSGESLQPGQRYDWELVIPASGQKRSYSFVVMEQPERERIAAELSTIAAELEAAGATDEEIALERANYFAERGLWSDAFQEISFVENPSAAFTSSAQEMLAYLCKSSVEIGQSN